MTISCRGASFEVGRGRGFYGIWAIGAPDDKPLAWWPETDEGWSAAWQRFTQIEVPGTISTVRQGPAPAALNARTVIAAALLGVGVVLGIVGLFPGYIGTPSLASLPGQLVAHLIYLAGWAGCSALVFLGGTRQRIGGLAGIGVSAITLGLFASDAATAATAKAGTSLIMAGLILTLISWGACTAGAILAFASSRQAAGPARPGGGRQLVPLVALIVAGIGAAIAFAPSWDRFTVESISGPLQSITEGNAFSNPGAVIGADVATMIALVAVVVVAALWRRASLGAALLAGALVPLVGQVISALVQLGQAVSPDQFGYTPVQIYTLGLTVSSGVTIAFWVFCGFVIALILSVAQMVMASDAALPTPPVATPATFETAPQGASAEDTVLDATALDPEVSTAANQP